MKRSREAQDIQPFLTDESRMPGGAAEEVFWPETPEDVAGALLDCARRGVPVTVSGGGTGIVGGRVPQGGVVLATDRLNKIVDLRRDPASGGAVMRVQAGAPLSDVQKAAAGERMWYPPDPTETSCWIGGAIATNASGARSFCFGATRRWVERVLVALPDGALLDLPRGLVHATNGEFRLPGSGRAIPAPDWRLPATTKHAAGYFSAHEMDLVDLFVGSEGTLGVIVEADLRLIPAPAAMISGILFFDDEQDALALVAAARDGGDTGVGVRPAALEFFDAAALELLREKSAPAPLDARAGIFFEQPVNRGEAAEPFVEAWGLLAETYRALGESWMSDDPVEQQKFRELRHLVPTTINEKIAQRGVRKVSTDTAVPPGRAGDLLEAYRAILDPAGLECVAFGHIGDDHLHVNILPKGPEQLDAAKAVYGRLVREAIRLGGTISAEHGLGKLKRQDLALLHPPAAIERMRAIKRALDPLWLLGRGTLFPD